MFARFNFSYDTPVVCTAIHNGHNLSAEFNKTIAISEDQRLLEEDPFTELFTSVCNNRITVNVSRFQVDLNRKIEKCVYLIPEDCWGLQTRNKIPDKTMIENSQRQYAKFYSELKKHLTELKSRFGKFIVFDIHSFNERKGERMPDIVLGSSNMPEKFKPYMLLIKKELSKHRYNNKNLKVGVDVKFPGGNFPRWIHREFPENGCCVPIELKKTWMDGNKLNKPKQIELNGILKNVYDLILHTF
ncbi:MAG: N-formylglutamate amidohydrolase [Candidatus Cloacimonetes bacterium]|nr:N-formylglutamate amidohydrolase [Candidatus Cloacimonadota bacterium]